MLCYLCAINNRKSEFMDGLWSSKSISALNYYSFNSLLPRGSDSFVFNLFRLCRIEKLASLIIIANPLLSSMATVQLFSEVWDSSFGINKTQNKYSSILLKFYLLFAICLLLNSDIKSRLKAAECLIYECTIGRV